MEEKQRKVQLFTWFSAFAYSDFSKMNQGDFAKLFVELQHMIESGFYEREKKGVEVISINQGSIDHYAKLQSEFKTKFFEIMGKIADVKHSEDPGWTDHGYKEGFQRIPKEPYEDIAKMPIPAASLHVQMEIETCVDFPLIHAEDSGKPIARRHYNWRENGRINAYVNPLGQTSTILLLRFVETLNGLYLEDLIKCKACDHWFIHVSKRERMFCSNRCAARKGMQDRRAQVKAQNPEAYEEESQKSSQRARKSYEKKVRSKNPKAKIWSRPQKRRGK